MMQDGAAPVVDGATAQTGHGPLGAPERMVGTVPERSNSAKRSGNVMPEGTCGALKLEEDRCPFPRAAKTYVLVEPNRGGIVVIDVEGDGGCIAGAHLVDDAGHRPGRYPTSP